MRHDLDPIKTKRLSLLGKHQLTLTGIRWVGEPTDDEYAAARALDGVIKRVEAWVDGDLLVEYVRREKAKHAGLSARALVSAYAEEGSLPFEPAYERYSVANCFELLARSSKLKWSHHRLIWAYAGPNKADQLRWLAMAEKKDWSVRDLAAAMLKDQHPVPLPPAIQRACPVELQGAIDYVSSRLDEVDTLTPTQAATIAAELEPVVNYHALCKQRAATGTEAVVLALSK